MDKIDYSKLREHDAAPLLELEEQLRQRIRREAEAGEQEEKKKKRGRKPRR